MAKPVKYSSRQLTQFLRAIAADASTIDDEGNLITKGEALARLLFKKALGYHESEDPDDPSKKTYHKPEAWAMQMIWERLEGKAPMAMMDEKSGLSAEDRVSELATARLNSYAEAVVSVPPPPRYMGRSDNRDQGAKEPS